MLKISFINKKNILILIDKLFIFGFLLVLFFSVLEIIKPKIVTSYLNLGWFFLFVILAGVISVFYNEEMKPAEIKLGFFDYSAIFMFSCLVGLFCLFLSRPLGWLCLLIAFAGAIICYFFTLTILES